MSEAAQLGIELSIPRCRAGIGKILPAASSDIIDGVSSFSAENVIDASGLDVNVKGGFGELSANTYISLALSNPGAIRAFRVRRTQDFCWITMVGILQIGLIDLRLASKTFGLKNTIYTGAAEPARILVPHGVAYGYRVIGADQSILFEVAPAGPTDTRDIVDIDFNDASIAYEWYKSSKTDLSAF